MLAGIYGAAPGPRARKPRRPWRESFAEIRAALKKAEKLTGKAREHALIRIARAYETADSSDAPGWRINKKGEGVRTESAETRAFDRATIALDRKIMAACGCCLGCFAMRALPEDELLPPRRRGRPISRRRPGSRGIELVHR